MNMSSAHSLKRIALLLTESGHDSVSSERVRSACLMNNFNVENAIHSLIIEEQTKKILNNYCVRAGHISNATIILHSCQRYDFDVEEVKKYTMKLLKAKSNVRTMCIEANITVTEDELDKNVIGTHGNETFAFNNILQL